MRDALRTFERLIKRRREILEELGGLPEPKVVNKEWLYLLKEETRNSIMIEGYFVSEEELEEVLEGKVVTRDERHALNYFKTAKFIYELAFENYRAGEFFLKLPLIRQINKSLGYGGELRKGRVIIAGAKCQPPEYFLEDWLKVFATAVEKLDLNDLNFNKVAVLHAFFEEIHPFDDGNGRTGRILLNYILISGGYPPVIFKGEPEAKREYYESLEEVDSQLEGLFEIFQNRKPTFERIETFLEGAKSVKLRRLILQSLRESLDRMIINRVREREELKPVGEIVRKFGYSPSGVRKLIERGKIIAIKENNRWVSTESLVKALLV